MPVVSPLPSNLEPFSGSQLPASPNQPLTAAEQLQNGAAARQQARLNLPLPPPPPLPTQPIEPMSDSNKQVSESLQSVLSKLPPMSPLPPPPPTQLVDQQADSNKQLPHSLQRVLSMSSGPQAPASPSQQQQVMTAPAEQLPTLSKQETCLNLPLLPPPPLPSQLMGQQSDTTKQLPDGLQSILAKLPPMPPVKKPLQNQLNRDSSPLGVSLGGLPPPQPASTGVQLPAVPSSSLGSKPTGQSRGSSQIGGPKVTFKQADKNQSILSSILSSVIVSSGSSSGQSSSRVVSPLWHQPVFVSWMTGFHLCGS